jgi:mannitol-1-phosphate 5-dehydrogenase
MPTAVQFGAGKIGRGFLGQLLFEGGYEILFVDVDSRLVDRLNQTSTYDVRLVFYEGLTTVTVGNYRAIEANCPGEVTDAILHADLILTAVGAANLPHVAKRLAEGIRARKQANAGPVDLLLCENQWHAAALVQQLLQPRIGPDVQAYFQARFGIVETVIGRTVPFPTAAAAAEDPLLLISDASKELPIAKDMLKSAPPALPGLILADNIEAYEARKLYLHNMGHALLAYGGYRRGFEYLRQCALDSTLAAACRSAFAESSQALCATYGFAPHTLETYTDDLMRRFANRALDDTVARVAADPLRKLRPSDRLAGAAQMCVMNGIIPSTIAGAIADALRYDEPSDPSARTLRTLRQMQGDAYVLQSICGIEPASSLGELVLGSLSVKGIVNR